MRWIEQHEMNHLESLQGLFVFETAQNGQINGVIIVRPRCQRAIEDRANPRIVRLIGTGPVFVTVNRKTWKLRSGLDDQLEVLP